MCDLCNEFDGADLMQSCQDCGCLICFDVENGDDVLRSAYVTASGDLFCDRCGREIDRLEQEGDKSAGLSSASDRAGGFLVR